LYLSSNYYLNLKRPDAPTAAATLQPTLAATKAGTITVSAPAGTGITYNDDGST
jgi:hypothetical protein